MKPDRVDCRRFAELIVEDDPSARRQALQHAETCEACAEVVAADELLAALVDQWKAEAPLPRASLELQVLAAIRAEKQNLAPQPSAAAPPEAGGRVIAWRRPAAWPRPVWAAVGAIAATLAIGAMLLTGSVVVTPGPERAERLLVADALRDADAAERAHARAIARLEEAAAPIIAAADDPDVAGNRAARLMAFRSRLRFLDETIAEIDSFVDGNPGHSGARTMLLAAYVEKTEVLREVIAFAQETES